MSTTDELTLSASEYAQRGVDKAKDMSSTAYEKAAQAARASQGYYDALLQQSQQVNAQVCDTTKHYWSNFPPLRWFVYTLTAFNAIPLAFLIGWAIVTFGFVFAIAGIGVLIAEGVFGFFGLAAFLPVAATLTFFAILLAGFATFAWGGVNTANIVLSKLGLVDEKKLSEHTEHIKHKATGGRRH
jgi:ABC-type multidrug transport system permease subunit